jgi:hypothetical protein
MKNKLLALLATIGLVGSASAVKINDNISINGFIDTSWSSVDTSAPNDDNDLDVDEVELNFLVNAGNVSGELHIDSGEANAGSSLDIEQVHFTYGFENGVSVQIGQFGSALGLEREDPAGLYTYSRAYGDNRYNLGNVDSMGIQEGNVGEGVRLAYSTDSISAGFAAYNGVGAAEETSVPASSDDLNYEFSLTFTGVENLSITAGVQGQRNDGANDIDTTNLHAAYTLDKLLLAAEYVNVDDENLNNDFSGFMILADYDINDKMGIAVRFSEWDEIARGSTNESDQITIAPNYAITDSLGAILEYSSSEVTGGDETDSLALEVTFTF